MKGVPWGSIKEFLLNALFPPICVHCRTDLENQKQFLCDSCTQHIVMYDGFYCPQCGARSSTPFVKCHRVPYTLACACRFQDPLPALIHAYKYHPVPKIGQTLSALILMYLSKTHASFEEYSIVPIPLHPKKERQRGFNQSTYIARLLSSYMNIPLLTDALIRIRQTKTQAFISKDKRVENVQNSFLVSNPEKIKGKNILLIDDVSTSGATLNAAAQELKKEGARHIVGLVVAKA